MPEQTKPTLPQVPGAQIITATKAKFVDSSGYQSFYCNNVGFAVNQLDVILYLGEILEISPSGEATIERRARVTMNPSQAKALIQILSQVIGVYESQNGPIRELAQVSPLPNEG